MGLLIFIVVGLFIMGGGSLSSPETDSPEILDMAKRRKMEEEAAKFRKQHRY